MSGKVIPLRTTSPSGLIAEQLQASGIDPRQIDLPQLVDESLIGNTFELLIGYLSDRIAKQRLEAVGTTQRFQFSVDHDPSNSETIGYRPQLFLPAAQENNRQPEVIGLHVSPRAIGRTLEPLVILARACGAVDETATEDKNHTQVIRVAASSTFALALSYAVFCEFGRFDTNVPINPCPELDAIVEFSDGRTSVTEVSGENLRKVALRFAGGVAMGYMANFSAHTLEGDNPDLGHNEKVLMFSLILKSMALQDRQKHPINGNNPVSYALEHAYSTTQLNRVGNLWFRVSP